MMNMPSTNLRTHSAILRDGREILLTQKQYLGLREDKADLKPSEPTTVLDPDTGEILYDGEIGAIKEFRERGKRKFATKNYYCGFGIAHAIDSECECTKRYNVNVTKFVSRMYELFGKKTVYHVDSLGREHTAYSPLYPQDLTPSQRRQILDSITI